MSTEISMNKHMIYDGEEVIVTDITGVEIEFEDCTRKYIDADYLEPIEPKFNVGERVLYNGYEREILEYDSNENTYLICWFVRDTWVDECELEVIT